MLWRPIHLLPISQVLCLRSSLSLYSELPFVLRYLGRFPSEGQVKLFLPQLLDDPNSQYLTYDKVEPYLLEVLQRNEFMPASYEELINTFKRLDLKNKGFIKVDQFRFMVSKSE